MKEVLQHVKDVLEQAFDHPEGHHLDQCIRELEEAKKLAGSKAQMIGDVINAVTNARNAQNQLFYTGDISSTNAFGEAYRAIDQAIESYLDENDQYN